MDFDKKIGASGKLPRQQATVTRTLCRFGRATLKRLEMTRYTPVPHQLTSMALSCCCCWLWGCFSRWVAEICWNLGIFEIAHWFHSWKSAIGRCVLISVGHFCNHPSKQLSPALPHSTQAAAEKVCSKGSDRDTELFFSYLFLSYCFCFFRNRFHCSDHLRQARTRGKYIDRFSWQSIYSQRPFCDILSALCLPPCPHESSACTASHLSFLFFDSLVRCLPTNSQEKVSLQVIQDWGPGSNLVTWCVCVGWGGPIV